MDWAVIQDEEFDKVWGTSGGVSDVDRVAMKDWNVRGKQEIGGDGWVI